MSFTNKSPFPVTINVELGALASAIISAIEYGSGYWASDARGIIPDEVRAALTDEQRENLESWGKVPFAAVTPGCHVEVTEHGGFDDEASHTERRFTHVEVARALTTIAEQYRWHLRTIMEGGDSDSGDVLFQLAALGEVVYG